MMVQLLSNLGATILKKLEVEHPVANLLVQLAQLQDSEVGDGTTSVVILASELLKKANELIKMNVHPTNIISGYKMAAREACRYVED
jgi:T-complex protein 1 subunit alpha